MTAVNTPQISVKLFKSVRLRTNVTEDGLSDNKEIDLTPYLQEGSSVSTHKALNTPNGGFTIRLADRFVRALNEPVYTLAEPMDAVEIRMSRVGKPVLVMRGVVTDVSLDESIGGDGKPSRIVTITGGDYGAFFRMMQINFLKGSLIGEAMLSMSGQYVQEKFGIPNGLVPAGAFVIYLVSLVVNKNLEKLSNTAVPGLLVDTSGADNSDMVPMLGFQANPQGTMWSHLQEHGNIGPFYEMLFDDGEAATTLVYRKPAFKRLNTNGSAEYIFPETSAESFSVKPDEITSIKRSRSEHDVSNFYFVRAPKGDFYTAIDTLLLSVVGDGSNLYTGKVQNCEESVYGVRMLEASTNHGASLEPSQDKSANASGNSNLSTYLLKQIKYLQDCNVDNVAFESGTIRCNGSPDYKPGRYCEIDWGNGVKFTAYVVSVAHTFEPFRGYTCTLQFVRGTEFASKLAAKTPYFYGKGS
jgi:hypothetical protein